MLYALVLKIMCVFNSARGLADFLEVYPNTSLITNTKSSSYKYENIKKERITRKIFIFYSKNIIMYCYILLVSKTKYQLCIFYTV